METLELNFQNRNYVYEKSNIHAETKKGYTFGEKAKLIFVLTLFGALVCGMIMLTAYSSNIKYKINETNTQIRMAEGEIENLTVEIKQASSIEAVEERAFFQLGMIYPSSNQIVFIDSNDVSQAELASALKEEAFN